MVTLAVLVILVRMAAPAMTEFLEKHRVKRAAETMAASLYLAKSEAIKRNTNVRVVFTGSGATWCYGLTTASSCTCSTANSCTLDAGGDTAVSSSRFPDIQITPPGASLSFSPLRGTVNGNSITFTSENGYQLRAVLSNFGRVRLCSPSGEGNLGGYDACS